jgi:hypothetical protein
MKENGNKISICGHLRHLRLISYYLMHNIHPAAIDPGRLLAECEQRFTRRSGPGGQNRNKVETAVILRHRPTGLVAEASERRTQGENRDRALFRLRLAMALEIRRPFEGAPSVLWRSRCHGGRLAISPAHDDFPALLAEALDVLEVYAHDARTAASSLGCSATQLVGLLRDEPRALAMVNAHRAALALHAYR